MLKTGLRCVFSMFYIYKRCRFACSDNCKMDCSFSPFTQFGACIDANIPHFSALYTPKLHLCTLVPMYGIPVYHTPKPHLGYPIFPFGVFYGAFMPHFGDCFTPLFVYVFPTFGQKDACKTQVYPLFERGNSCLNVPFT